VGGARAVAETDADAEPSEPAAAATAGAPAGEGRGPVGAAGTIGAPLAPAGGGSTVT
jgi:hypothetical protein